MFYKGNQKIGVNMTTHENIKKIRLELCLSQSELARELGLTVSSVSCYERGTRKPSFCTIRKIIALAKKHRIKIKFEDVRPE